MNSKPRILQVIDKLEVGGAEKICVTLTNLLYENKNDVSMLLLIGGGELKSILNTEVPIIELHKKSNFNMHTMYKCSQVLNRYDIIHVHMRYNYKYIKLINSLFFLKNKILLHDHYGNIDKDISIPFGFKSLFKPSYYIGVSNSLINWALIDLKIKKSNVFLLRNIVRKENVKSNMLKKGFVLVGNIKPIKNQLFALQLIQHFDTTITFYGNIQDQVYYKRLLKEIDNLKIAHKVFFKHDCINIQKELVKYELGLQTAFSESGPLVVIEYLAQSLPFLSYNTGEVIKLIENDIPNFIINKFEINEWVEKLLAILNTSKKNDLKMIYEKHFSEQTFLNNCENIYKNIFNQKV